MELKAEGDDKPQPRWDEAVPAFGYYRPGVSPYVHQWLEASGRTRLGQTREAPLTSLSEEALRAMVEGSFGE